MTITGQRNVSWKHIQDTAEASYVTSKSSYPTENCCNSNCCEHVLIYQAIPVNFKHQINWSRTVNYLSLAFPHFLYGPWNVHLLRSFQQTPPKCYITVLGILQKAKAQILWHILLQTQNIQEHIGDLSLLKFRRCIRLKISISHFHLVLANISIS